MLVLVGRIASSRRSAGADHRCLLLIAWYLISNTGRTLAARHIATGFGFLGHVAGFPIDESLIPYDPAVSTFGRALWIGVLNTLKVSLLGIMLATVLGTLIGIGRLSANWLLARLATFYVELLRDIPLLLQLLFWYALLHGLPGPRRAVQRSRLGLSESEMPHADANRRRVAA